jgi:thioredoxin domain-containing protein 5
LTEANYDDSVKEGTWFVEFFAPWCGHCKKLAPTWEHLATQLKGKANIAKVDCTTDKPVCSKMGVSGFPTLKLIEAGEDKEKYSGPRTASALSEFLKKKDIIDTVVADVDGGKKEERKPAPAAAEPTGPSDVTVLTEADFTEKTAEGMWLIEFYAPWCGHCKRLAPTWDHLAKELKGKANIAKVDCTATGDLCSNNGVRGFPTIKLFSAGEEVEKYAGSRDTDAFVTYMKEKGMIEQSVQVNAMGAAPNQPAKKPSKPAEEKKEEGPTNIVVLGDDYADKTKEGLWFVKFYAPWCGHCKRLAPTWEELATKYNKVSNGNVAKVDCTVHSEVCKGQGVRGYPTLKFFKDGEEVAYAGGRDMASFDKFLGEQGVEAKAAAAGKDEL